MINLLIYYLNEMYYLSIEGVVRFLSALKHTHIPGAEYLFSECRVGCTRKCLNRHS